MLLNEAAAKSFFRYVWSQAKDEDLALLYRLVEKMIPSVDFAILNLTPDIAKYHPAVAIKLLKELATRDDDRLLHRIAEWLCIPGQAPSEWAIEIADAQDYQQLLTAILRLPQLDGDVQLCLGRLAQVDPLLVVDALEARVRRQAQMQGRDSNFETIPHGVCLFADDLRSQPSYREVLRRLLDWALSSDTALRARTVEAIKAVAGGLNETLAEVLVEWIESGEVQKQRTVASVLQEFNEGEKFYTLCRHLLLHSNDTVVRAILKDAIGSTPGAIWGSFPQFYRKRIEEISPWLSDSDERIHQFAQQVIQWLQQRLSDEDE